MAANSLSASGLQLGGSGSANLMDDYEEGTWTPSLQRSGGGLSVSYTARDGKYTKVGNIVHCSFRMRVTSHSGGSGEFQIFTLPFTPVTAGADHIGVSVAGLENHPIGTGEQLIQVMDNSTVRVRLLKAQNNGGWAEYTPNSAFAVYMSFSYPTT